MNADQRRLNKGISAIRVHLRLSAVRSLLCAVESLESRRLLSASATLADTSVLYIVGAIGNDTIEVMQTGANVSVSDDGNLLPILHDGVSLGDSVDTTTHPVKRINIAGLTGNDVITYDASVAAPGVIREGSGADQIFASGAQPMAITANNGQDIVSLGDGDYSVSIGSGGDSVAAGDGDDVIDAYGGDDTFSLGDGDDLLGFVGGQVNVIAGTGNDSIYASGGADSRISVSAGSGSDYISAGRGQSLIDMTGSSGDSVIHLGRGDGDTLRAGTGDDLIFDEGGLADSIQASTGTDTVLTLAGTDTIGAADGGADEIVFLTTGNSLTGAAADTVWGSNAPNPNTSGIPTSHWIHTLPPHWGLQLAAWEAME